MHQVSEYSLIPISDFCGKPQKSFVDWVKIHLGMTTPCDDRKALLRNQVQMQ